MGFSRQEYWSGVPLPSPNPSRALKTFSFSFTFLAYSNKENIKIIRNLAHFWTSLELTQSIFLTTRNILPLAYFLSSATVTYNYIHFSGFPVWRQLWKIKRSVRGKCSCTSLLTDTCRWHPGNRWQLITGILPWKQAISVNNKLLFASHPQSLMSSTGVYTRAG